MRLILGLDLLCDVKAFFEEGGADSLGGGYSTVRTKELSIDSLAVRGDQSAEQQSSQKNSVEYKGVECPKIPKTEPQRFFIGGSR